MERVLLYRTPPPGYTASKSTRHGGGGGTTIVSRRNLAPSRSDSRVNFSAEACWTTITIEGAEAMLCSAYLRPNCPGKPEMSTIKIPTNMPCLFAGDLNIASKSVYEGAAADTERSTSVLDWLQSNGLEIKNDTAVHTLVRRSSLTRRRKSRRLLRPRPMSRRRRGSLLRIGRPSIIASATIE